MTENWFAYPCRFKKRDDGTYFIRFPDLPEAIVDLVEEPDLYRAASKCLASVLFWRITNEAEIPPPSRPREEQLLIELTLARTLSDSIARGRSTIVDTGDIDAMFDYGGASLDSHENPDRAAHDPQYFAPVAVAAE